MRLLELLVYYIILQQHINRYKLLATHAQAHKALHCVHSKTVRVINRVLVHAIIRTSRLYKIKLQQIKRDTV